MGVCSYYLRGACKYGERCRNEHPGAVAGNFGNQTWTSSNDKVATPYTVESMAADVTPSRDKPLWPLSSYGPAKHEPVVIGGLDESPEELRLKAVIALRGGAADEYTKYEGEKTAAADRTYANARDNAKQMYAQALKASTQALNQPPESAAGTSVSAFTTSTPSAFGTNSTSSAFGGSSAPAFGKSAFGQPAFGQTGFGNPASGTSAFSQGSQETSAFGAPARPASAFGQPSQATSAFGQPAQTTAAFSQPAQPNSVFGQPSAFGATTQSTSVFGKPSQPTSAFGQPSQPTSAFGPPPQPMSAFGQPPQPTSGFARFGQPTSAFSQTPQPAPAFGQSSQPAFGQSSLVKPASGAFGGMEGGGFSSFASRPSVFTSAATSSAPANGTAPDQSAFGSAPQVRSAFGTVSSEPRSVFGATQPAPLGTASIGNTLSVPASSSPASAVGGGSSPFASSPMTVTPSNERAAPSGALDFASAKSMARMKPGADRYLVLLPHDYNEIMPADVKAAFASATFEWGKIPDWTPPEGVR